MILKQYYLSCLAHASYLIADEQTKTAAVVDPQRDIDQYVQEAESHGWIIRYVFLTHFHADFLAGHLELRNRTGAEICLGAQAQAEYPFRPLKDGEVVEFGRVRLKILETPGHTPEAISILLFDLDQSETAPHAVLTGDTLFIGDVGRPDLFASVGMSAKELAGALYESLHSKLLPLPDDTLVYPAHGAGSMCGKHLSPETFSTLGTQRRDNYALQPMRKEDFVELVTSNQPEVPLYFGFDAMLNRQEHPTLDAIIQRGLLPLSLNEVLVFQRNGAQVLDVRDPADFAREHLAGSINIGLNGNLATWTGTILAPEISIVLIADPGREWEAVMQLGRIGYDHVAGCLMRGIRALEARPDLLRRTERITAAELAEHIANDQAPQVLDVRTEPEREEGRIDHSLHIPLNQLQTRMGEVPRGGALVVHCASGYRSSIAASLLKRAGVNEVMDLLGGYEAWQETWQKYEKPTVETCSSSSKLLMR